MITHILTNLGDNSSNEYSIENISIKYAQKPRFTACPSIDVSTGTRDLSAVSSIFVYGTVIILLTGGEFIINKFLTVVQNLIIPIILDYEIVYVDKFRIFDQFV